MQDTNAAIAELQSQVDALKEVISLMIHNSRSNEQTIGVLKGKLASDETSDSSKAVIHSLIKGFI